MVWAKLISTCNNPLGLTEEMLQESLKVCPPREYGGAKHIERCLVPRTVLRYNEEEQPRDKNNDSKLRITYGYFINPINSQNMLDNWDKIIPNIFPFIHLTKPTLCHRPVSPDGLPIICKDREISNLYFNIGHGFLGWTLSCASAKLITDIIEGKEPSIDLSMRRFQLFGGFCGDIL